MGNPARSRDSKGRLRKMTSDDKLRRGSKRMGRAERRGDANLIDSSFPRPGVVSRLLFGDNPKR